MQDADAVKSNPRTRKTAKYLQHISPLDSLWTLYKKIEGELIGCKTIIHTKGNPRAYQRLAEPL
jgi:hypothetical protein